MSPSHFTAWDRNTGVKYVVSSNQISRYLDDRKSLFDFTPGACRFAKQNDSSSGEALQCAVRRTKLTDTHLEGQIMRWVLSEGNAVAFTINWRISSEPGASFIIDCRLQELSSGVPQVLEIWAF